MQPYKAWLFSDIIEKNKITIFPASVIIDMAPRSPPIKITRKIKINARKMIILRHPFSVMVFS